MCKKKMPIGNQPQSPKSIKIPSKYAPPFAMVKAERWRRNDVRATCEKSVDLFDGNLPANEGYGFSFVQLRKFQVL